MRSAETSRTAAALTSTSTIARSVNSRSTGPWRTRAKTRRTSCGPAVRPTFRAGRQAHPPRARLTAQGERVPVRGQARPDVRTNRRAGRLRRARLRPHAQALDSRPRRDSLRQLWSSREAQGHDPRAAFAILEAQDGAVEASIRRVCYDAGAVAHEMRAVGLPEELAEKLVAGA